MFGGRETQFVKKEVRFTGNRTLRGRVKQLMVLTTFKVILCNFFKFNPNHHPEIIRDGIIPILSRALLDANFGPVVTFALVRVIKRKYLPKLPLMYALYNGNSSHARKHLVRALKKRIPEVGEIQDVWMVLNDDAAVVEEIATTLPNISLVRSPGDILCTVQNWFHVDSSRGSSDNVDEILKDVTKLLRCNTHDEYLEKLCLSKLMWSSDFKLFFHDRIEKNKLKSQGWNVKQRDSNKHDDYLLARCPDFEQMILAFQQWVDVPVEYIVIGLHFLCCYFANNNTWAKMGYGSYTLLQKLHRAFSLPADSSNIYSVPNPSDVITFLKQNSFERVFEMMTTKRDAPRQF